MNHSDDSDEPTSADLLNRLAAGDESAAAEVFNRYADRLTRLARSRLAAKLAARVDPEDIVISAYRSFFVAVRHGRFELERGGDLWRLLVEVTLHKLYRTAAHHQFQQRSVRREQPLSGDTSAIANLAGREPTPDEAAAAADELEAVLQQFDERDRRALELRLQGYEQAEIADRLGCTERTVRRAMAATRRLFAARGGSDFVPSAARRRATGPGHAPQEQQRLSLPPVDAPLRWNEHVLHEQIGFGATGRVYRATCRTDGREVAIKFLRKSLVGNASAMQRFLQEAKTVAALSHPNIVAIHGAGQTPGGGLFLVMDLVRGPDLQRAGQERPVSTSQALAWINQAAAAVQHAHRAGVIHCDLKPSNLLLDANGDIRVTDFGFAVNWNEVSTGLAAVAGTPAFMAPEQVDACWGEISPRTDVWGLGGVFYFLLFGDAPHRGDDISSTLANVVSKRPVEMPIEPRNDIPSPVIEIVRRCLRKPPAERFASAEELLNATTALSSRSGQN